MAFNRLGLIEPLLRAVRSEGYAVPTAIQQQAIPHVLEGRDLLGCAQTGTGKTAAFALPILQRLADSGRAAAPARGGRPVRALILTPTRELAAQIGDSLATYGRHTGLRHTVIYGGVGQGPQAAALRRGVDLLVATPGRLLDLIGQRLLTLDRIEIFVLDEADRMLDMGFIHDIRRVVALIPERRQTLMFSATMPREIQAMADQVLVSPVRVRVPAESPAADTVRQSLYFVDHARKGDLLDLLLRDPQVTRALVFARTKRGADRVTRRLVRSSVAAEAIHSNKSQNARMRALENFRLARTRVLVASDIAARGLDVEDISHVINYDLPAEPETYVHRIGRTGRAGATGQAITFCTDQQHAELRQIERLLGRQIPVLRHSLGPAATAAGGGQRPAQPNVAAAAPVVAADGSDAAAQPTGQPRTSRRPKAPFWQGRRKAARTFSGRRRRRR